MMSWHKITTPAPMDLLVGFWDLTGYMRYCLKKPDDDVFRLMSEFFDLTGGIINDAGGRFVKAIGDAGLAAFPVGEADEGVRAFLKMKTEGEAMLCAQGVNSRSIVKLHVGPVIAGMVGAPGDKRFDIYGKTVNTAALLESKGFAMSPQVFRSLGKETRSLFKKHTPPVTYIHLDDRH